MTAHVDLGPPREYLGGMDVRLRRATVGDVDRIVAIRSTSEVRHRWAGDDLVQEFLDDIGSDEMELFVIENLDGQIIGGIQWSEETDPMYRHAGIDLYIDPNAHGRGYGTDAVRTLITYLIDIIGHQRFVIDPAADNQAAIACYGHVGFKPVGIMRRYERSPDGTWHDGLLMDLLADEFVRTPSPKLRLDLTLKS